MTISVRYKPTILFVLAFVFLVKIGCNPYKQETELIKVYAQRIDEYTWSDLNFKLIEIDYIDHITANDSLLILDDQIRRSVQLANIYLSDLKDSYKRTLNSLKTFAAKEPKTPWNEARVIEFHEYLINLQSDGWINGLPESYSVFSKAFAQADYRSQIFSYLKTRKDAGVKTGLPNTLQEFQDFFWPEEPPIDSVSFQGLKCIDVNYYTNLEENLSTADINYIFELEERILSCEKVIKSNNKFLDSGDIQSVTYISGELQNRLEILKQYELKPDSILGHIYECIYEIDDPSLEVRNTVTAQYLFNGDRTEILKRLNSSDSN